MESPAWCSFRMPMIRSSVNRFCFIRPPFHEPDSSSKWRKTRGSGQMSHSLIPASALDLIGRTPLIALDRAHPGPGRILAKAEFLQPGGSVKDRAARAILLAARADGRLRPGAPVVEMTSGNMGAGLAVGGRWRKRV